MAAYAEQIVEQNGLADVVEVVHARVEDVELSEKADVLVSEWMARRGSPSPWLAARLSLPWPAAGDGAQTARPPATGVPPPARDDARERDRGPRHSPQA